MASLQQESAEVQALQGKEALLANIVEEEMAHWAQVSVLCLNYIYNRPKRLSPNLMRRDIFPLCWKNSRLSMRESRNSRVGCQKCPFLKTPHHILRNFEERHLIYYLVWYVPDEGAGLVHISGITQDILVAGRAHFENDLAEEATWEWHSQPHHVHFP